MPPVPSTNLLHDEALTDSPDWQTFSLIYGSGGGAIEETEEYVTAASSSWSCSSRGRVCRDEIERNEETEDTASSVGAKIVTSVDDAISKEELLSTSMKEENKHG